MKRFNITVNGNAYDVAVEEITDSSAPVAAAAPVQTKKVAAPAAAPAKKAAGAGTKVSAPMPGTILEIKVKEGDSVKKGQPVMVLEAMKMENDIVAPCDGKITSIVVNKGDTVESADTLATIQ